MMKIMALALAMTALGTPAVQAKTCKPHPPKKICRVEHHPKICKVDKDRKHWCHHVTHTSCHAPV